MLKPCANPACSALVERGKCAKCAAKAEQRRGTTRTVALRYKPRKYCASAASCVMNGAASIQLGDGYCRSWRRFLAKVRCRPRSACSHRMRLRFMANKPSSCRSPNRHRPRAASAVGSGQPAHALQPLPREKEHSRARWKRKPTGAKRVKSSPDVLPFGAFNVRVLGTAARGVARFRY